MKFMLLMNTPRNGYEEYMKWPKKVLEANIAFMIELSRKLRSAGELVSTEGLASPTEAKLVHADEEGRPVTDGVFPESKEFLAGYWIVDVDNAERACQIAAEASTAPGIGDKPLRIEVRQIMSSHRDMK
ncbi:MAG TPA: YciI family protein [Povalibacter sp.]|nr:YciI family protein [Povalibacter sp.]